MKKSMVLLLLLHFGIGAAFGQFSLHGRVTDSGGIPLPGASVVLSGTYYGISADADGEFVFHPLKAGRYTLIVTYIGFEAFSEELLMESDREIGVVMKPAVVLTGEVMVQATRVKDKTPVAYTNISRETLLGRNMGQDLPFLLMQTPSLVATSDAGSGIGYTSFRVRGTDMNRMNVTVNGIPLNDAESHTTFFVDQPDLASSADMIQVQRGAGTSSNGGAAFGATINLQTLALKPEPYGDYQASAGSFSTLKNTLAAGTGLLSKRFTVDARMSGIHSDGYIDRASGDLSSLYFSAGYYSENTVVKGILFSGWEETYQAWNGVPSVRLKNDPARMQLYQEHGLYSEKETDEMIASGDRTYNLYTYKNQVDNYRQDNYQLHFSHSFSRMVNLNLSLHYTSGRGYYEQYKASQKFGDYNLPKPVVNGVEITRTDLVRRKWLDNDFFGTVFSLNYTRGKTDFSWGGGWNSYNGNHFGRVIWGEFLGAIPPDYEWYRNRGRKSDFNSYAKMNYQVAPALSLFADIQYRRIDYEVDGVDDDLRELDLRHNYGFFNPKAGFFYQPDSRNSFFASYARTHREPNRDNFVDTPPGGTLPEPESMNDLEAGWTFRSSSFMAGANLYHMFYHNQLVLTGRINDVGAPVMTNVEKSSRTGLELTWGVIFAPAWRWDGNATLSRNKIRGFTEYVDAWDSGVQQSFYLGITDLAFSPAISGNSQLMWQPGKFSVTLISSFVGKQYIDNTSSEDRILDAWFVNHLKAEYILPVRIFKKATLHFQVNNLLNEEYESNAWVYSYILGGIRYKMDGYFPQAGRHYMVGINISL